jgi:hypothetical protein
MEMNPHRRRGLRTKRAELVHRPDRDLDPGGCRRLGVDPGGVQPREDRHRQPRGAQRRSLRDTRRPEPPGPGGNGGFGDRDGAVAEPSALTMAMIVLRVRARISTTFAVTATGSVCKVGGGKVPDLR